MSGALMNGLLLAAVVLLTLLPLLIVKPPAAVPGAEPTAIFTGTDAQAQGVIQTLAPEYQPWSTSRFKPPSVEIESLLFALQAALGAGVIGYYAGYVRGKKSATPPPDRTDRAY